MNALNVRANQNLNFKSKAVIAQSLKEVMYDSKSWKSLECDKKEALEMIQHSIARILNGEANYKDTWNDITIYSTLISDCIGG